MIDLTAPIVPGVSAAGITLRTPIDPLLVEHGLVQTERRGGRAIYELPSIKIWVVDRLVTQIGVSTGYLGKVNHKISIGSTIREVEELFHLSVVEDEEDNLCVQAMPGWSFETTEWISDHSVKSNLDACIVEIFVY